MKTVVCEVNSDGTLLMPDGIRSIYSLHIIEPNPHNRLRQLQLQLRGAIDFDFWEANYRAKFGAARQDGRSDENGFKLVDDLALMPKTKRTKLFNRLHRIDWKRFSPS